MLCALLALVPFTGLEAQGKGVLIVFVWAILMWIVRPIPEYLIGVLAAAVLAIFFGMKTNVVPVFQLRLVAVPVGRLHRFCHQVFRPR